MAIKPLTDHVIVRDIKPDGETNIGGIIISENMSSRPMESIVVAIGPGTDKLKPTFSVGDTVLTATGGCEIEQGDETLRLLQFEDIKAIID
jgi:co-chaperonin GroES (HSP10)